MMDFENFMEKTMLQYLDRKVAEVADKVASLREEEFSMFEITSDYAKEINNSLRQGNIENARQILNEVRDKYMQAPEGSISRKRLYAIMEEIYEKIKDFEGGSDRNSLLETIREYEKQALLKNPELFSKKDESASLVISTINLKEKEIQDVLENPNPSHDDVEAAARSYRELKELINRLPNEYLDLKGKMLEKATTAYNAIREKMALKFGTQGEKNPEEQARLIENKLAEIRMLKKKIVESHDIITECLAKEDLTGSVKEYRRLKKYCYLFPKDLSGERLALLSDTKSLYEKIHALKEKKISKGQEPLDLPSQENTDFIEEETESDNNSRAGEMRNQIAVSAKTIASYLEAGSIKEAAEEYEHLKKLSTQFPNEPDPQEKVEVLSNTLAIYGRIRKAKQMLELRNREAESDHENELKEQEQFDSYRKELLNRIVNVSELIKAKKTGDAISEFSSMKNFFNQYPDENLDRKKVLYDDIMDAHLDMSLLEGNQKTQAPAMALEKVAEIKKIISDAERNIRSEKVEAAEGMILEAKHKVAMLPRDDFDDKFALAKEIEYLEHQLVALKNLSGMKNKYESHD